MIKKEQISNALEKLQTKAKKMPQRKLQVLLALAILFAGIFFMFLLVKLRRTPEHIERIVLAPLVKVKQLNVADVQMIIRGYGTVTPKVEVEIVPEVFGKVVSINPRFKAGEFIPADQVLFKIDPRDYELAVQHAQAQVAEATVSLDLEKAEAHVAAQEWEQLHPGTEPSSPLVLHAPQIRQTEAKLESANAFLAAAKLNLERTTLSLPIDVRILDEQIDLGQYVSTGKAVGKAYGVEAVEIFLPIEDRELAWFDVPDYKDRTENKKLTKAIVKAEFAGAVYTWIGHVARTTGQIDRTSRLVSVVIEVPQPSEPNESRPPLQPGMFVEVFIEGNILKNAIAVDRDVIHNGNEVWVVTNGRLHIQSLKILRSEKKFSYVTSGLTDGAMIITSSVDTVIEGMKVRTESEKSPDELTPADTAEEN